MYQHDFYIPQHSSSDEQCCQDPEPPERRSDASLNCVESTWIHPKIYSENARLEKTSVVALKKDFKEHWIALESLLEQDRHDSPKENLTPEVMISRFNQLLMSYNQQVQPQEPDEKKGKPDGKCLSEPSEVTESSFPENIDSDGSKDRSAIVVKTAA